MNKLTIENLAPYFPYGLEVEHTTFNEGNMDKQVTKIESISDECVTFGWNCCDYYFEDPEPECEIKLLLRPLSDLTKEIEHNGEKFLPMERILLMVDNYPTHDTIQRYPLEMPYDVVVSLISWHFDVFNLIPQGLAIKTPQ